MAEDENDSTSSLKRTDLERPFATSDSPAVPLLSGMVLAGRYEIGKTIGRGGMGLVVQALDRTLGVDVAIKIVRAEYAGEREWSERLAREVKLARQIQHANVCRVFDYAQAEGRAFLIMELATGGTLRDELQAGTATARPLAARIADARAIAAGLGAIHAAGIVHRDISPQNALRMSDGRLVLSDFGLATDSFDGTTSIRGGTVAYMAPEVVRGGHASFAADIWALGAVIHETVFGQRLQWDPGSGEMRSSVAGQRLTRTERSVLEICTACLALNPTRRPRDADEIAARLSEAGLARTAGRRRRRQAATVTAAAFMIAAVVVGGQRVRSARRRAAAAAAAAASVDPLMIDLTGQPDDWTDKAKVVAEVPDRIRCLVRLPDHHTVRFLWGDPPRAEDVDIRTGRRVASPLVPEAHAEGCPDLTADGQRLVYTGHTPDDRAYAFVSPHPDGRDAVPEVQIAEPSRTSDPVWLPDGQSFLYDIDDKHVGVFSLETKHSEVVPTTLAPMFTSFHAVIGNQIFVDSLLQTGGSDIAGFSFPHLNETINFRLPGPMLDIQSPGGDTYYLVAPYGSEAVLAQVEPAENRGRFVGQIGGQSMHYPLFFEGVSVFVSSALVANLVRRSGGVDVRVRVGADLSWASRCGERIIASQAKDGTERTIWIDAEGRFGGTLADGTNSPRCSSNGRTMFWASIGQTPGVQRCDDAGCRTLFKGEAHTLALSPDDKRLAFLTEQNRGHVIRWVAADGRGSGREVAVVDTACTPVWSSDKDLWIALRNGRRVIWTEFDSDSARPTGRTSVGTHDCTDNLADPAAPGEEAVKIEFAFQSQLRVLPNKYLPSR
ncbi:MAG TPA: serine/threonine-protein kinase [Polyangia bacterium]|nr:serine/threonine-protein kinase [Polyangia bacterium]